MQITLRSNQTLPQLIETIRAEHAAIIESVNDTLSHVIAAGRALLAARGMVPKGEWGSWLKRNCEVSDRHARRYMALTQAYEASGHTVSGDLVGLSLRGLARRLTPPKTKAVVTRPSSKKKPSSRALSVTAWTDASPTERRSFIDAIGWAPLGEVIPSTWRPVIQQWLDHTTVSVPSDYAAPADLRIPDFLRRTDEATELTPAQNRKATIRPHALGVRRAEDGTYSLVDGDHDFAVVAEGFPTRDAATDYIGDCIFGIEQSGIKH